MVMVSLGVAGYSQSVADELYKKGKECHDKKEYKTAVEWYEMAAGKGSKGAQCALANCYLDGNGVGKNAPKAVEMLTPLANDGFAKAQQILAWCYLKGEGVEKNEKNAVEWYRKSAEQGYDKGEWGLGYCYHYGIGVEKDISKAVKWYRSAAAQGLSEAQNSLGVIYAVEIEDYERAVEWYTKAAEQGDMYAQDNLAWCYENGYGVTASKEDAVAWYREMDLCLYSEAYEELLNKAMEAYKRLTGEEMVNYGNSSAVSVK